jgi:C4-type Zn-finger protein
MQAFLLAILTAGKSAMITGVHGLLDIIYGNAVSAVNSSDNDLDNKALEIFVEAIHTWEPPAKN